MENKSVFFRGKPGPGAKAVLNMATGLAVHLVPDRTLKAAKKLLINPQSRRKVSFKELEPTLELDTPSQFGDVHLYYFAGGEKHILICHGWADTTQSMQTIIKSFVDKGYSVWAMDHVGHGKSEGNESHLFAYIDGLKNAIHTIEYNYAPVIGVVAHSAGAAAVLNLDDDFLKSRKFAVLGIPIKFFESMYNQMEMMGIHHKILTNLLNDLSMSFGLNWQELNPNQHEDKIGDHFLFVHDKDDEISPFDELKSFLKNCTSKLIVTEGLGHRKILKDEKVINQLVEFYE